MKSKNLKGEIFSESSFILELGHFTVVLTAGTLPSYLVVYLKLNRVPCNFSFSLSSLTQVKSPSKFVNSGLGHIIQFC